MRHRLGRCRSAPLWDIGQGLGGCVRKIARSAAPNALGKPSATALCGMRNPPNATQHSRALQSTQRCHGLCRVDLCGAAGCRKCLLARASSLPQGLALRRAPRADLHNHLRSCPHRRKRGARRSASQHGAGHNQYSVGFPAKRQIPHCPCVSSKVLRGKIAQGENLVSCSEYRVNHRLVRPIATRFRLWRRHMPPALRFCTWRLIWPALRRPALFWLAVLWPLRCNAPAKRLGAAALAFSAFVRPCACVTPQAR
jgi:hypothetical protein